MKVDIYFNLHLFKWSIRNRKTRRVESHATDVIVTNVNFVVSTAGRDRVRAEKRKNVHAFVRGSIEAIDLQIDHRVLKKNGYREAYYNPYKVDFFVDKKTKKKLSGTYKVYMDARDRSVWYKEWQ
jgi:hypothetical protein